MKDKKRQKGDEEEINGEEEIINPAVAAAFKKNRENLSILTSTDQTKAKSVEKKSPLPYQDEIISAIRKILEKKAEILKQLKKQIEEKNLSKVLKDKQYEWAEQDVMNLHLTMNAFLISPSDTTLRRLTTVYNDFKADYQENYKLPKILSSIDQYLKIEDKKDIRQDSNKKREYQFREALSIYIMERWNEALPKQKINLEKARSMNLDNVTNNSSLGNLYNNFLGKLFGESSLFNRHSAKTKLNAAIKLRSLLSESPESVEFSHDELNALYSSRLGEILTEYKGVIPDTKVRVANENSSPQNSR